MPTSRGRRPPATRPTDKKCLSSLYDHTKRIIFNATKEANSRSDSIFELRRAQEGMSPHLKRDIGLPTHGGALFISRDTFRCVELHDADFGFGTRHVGNQVEIGESVIPPSQSSIGVIIADICEFTTIAEAMAPTDVMGLLHLFYGRMETIASRHCGSLAVSSGDMLLITFGLPITGSSDATNALACAREMLDKQRQWNMERAAIGGSPISVGIGVHYGPAVSGMMGSERSMAFSVIGDTVNIARRLERLTRSLETDLVISAELIRKVYEEASLLRSAEDIEDLVPIGALLLEGRSERIDAYSLPKMGSK